MTQLIRLFVVSIALFGGLVSCAEAQSTGTAFNSTYAKLDTSRWFISNGWTNGPHQSCEWRADAFSIKGLNLVMTLSDNGGRVRPLGCPEMHTKARLGYGRYETRLRTAAGSGLNTAFFTYIGPSNGSPHDEIDFEFLGKAPNTVEVNHYVNDKVVHGKVVNLGFDSSKGFHDYAFDWTATSITWYVDGVKVYQTPAGVPIPTHPSYLFHSLWSGSPMEDAWMGHFTYTQPVTSEVVWTRFAPH